MMKTNKKAIGYITEVSNLHVCGYENNGESILVQTEEGAEPKTLKLYESTKGIYFILKGKRVYLKEQAPATAPVKEAKTETAATKETKETTFEDLYDTAMQEVKDAEAEVKRLEDLLSKAKDIERAKCKKVCYLRKVSKMSIYPENTAPFAWHMRAMGGSQYSKTAWHEVYEYHTATYDFTVVIKERTDLKKMKWEVSAYGTKVYAAERLCNSSEYRDHSYIRDRYTKLNEVLENKFASEADARRFLKYWQAKLVEDHHEDIEAEKKLSKLAKVMPRIKIGSVVVHKVYGEGVVMNNIDGDRWSVQFNDNGVAFKDRLIVSEDNLKLVK